MPWPTREWPEGPPAAGVDAGQLDALIAGATGPSRVDELGVTAAVLAVHGGRLVGEGYRDGLDASTTLPAWSMTKSILHAVVGILVGQGRLDVDAPAGLPQWSAPGDPRAAITLDHLLHMRSGLAWVEDYVDRDTSDVIEMLFGSGRPDVAAYAASRPLAWPVDTHYCYSSGTSNLVSAVTRDVVGDPPAYAAFLHSALFDRLGMTSPIPKFDAAGTWIASSYCFATARDFARFGLLYLRDGMWEDERLLPTGWVDHGRTPQADVDDEGWGYGAHWWHLPDREDGLFFANGHRGQYLVVVPALDLVVVRSGDSDATQRDAVVEFLTDLISCFKN
ncbi:MAG TPA: serine hydrolase [Acidimicrobiales bacterium]